MAAGYARGRPVDDGSAGRWRPGDLETAVPIGVPKECRWQNACCCVVEAECDHATIETGWLMPDLRHGSGMGGRESVAVAGGPGLSYAGLTIRQRPRAVRSGPGRAGWSAGPGQALAEPLRSFPPPLDKRGVG